VRCRRAAAFVVAATILACSSASTQPTSTTTAPARSRVEISPLEGRPSALAVGAGAVWVADDERGVVLRLDEHSGKQFGPAIAVSPHPIAIDVSDSKVWVADRAGTDRARGTPRRPDRRWHRRLGE